MNITVRDKVRKAYNDLRKQGYFCRMNFWCCQTCGWYAVPKKKANKAVFFHKQDNDHAFDCGGNLKQGHALFMAWSGDGQTIVNALKKQHLEVEWNGEAGTRIAVTK